MDNSNGLGLREYVEAAGGMREQEHQLKVRVGDAIDKAFGEEAVVYVSSFNHYYESGQIEALIVISPAKAADNRAEKVPGNNKFFILRDEALKQNPKLAECTDDSFKGALLSVLQLGINLDSHVTLVPKKNEETGSLECVFRLGHYAA
jgi:hypothetical protein